MSESNSSPDSPPAASYRTLEIVTAAIALLFGAVVAVESWRLGARWADDGPQAGYFPFYIGLITVVASLFALAHAVRNRAAAAETFVTRAQLRSMAALMVPATLYVATISFIGIYVSSAVFLAYFMARHGDHRWWTTAAVALGLPAVLFMMFEVWFRTPLPKGPLEALLGLD
jgi:uncharacterized membrane protein